MTREETTAFFARRQDAWRRHDAAALAADYAENCVVLSPMAGTLNGPAQVEKVYRSWFEAFPDVQFRGEDLLVDGNRAALTFTSFGTHVGNFMGLSATGRKFELHGVFIYTMDGNRITHERRVVDFTGLLIQIGVLKAKPAVGT